MGQAAISPFWRKRPFCREEPDMAGPGTILITGASSGIGRALALAYAEPRVRLALLGRDKERLGEVAAAASAKGAEIVLGELDVRDQASMARWIAEEDARRPFDLAIANAGITTGLGPNDLTEDPQAVRAILATNLVGVLNTVEPLRSEEHTSELQSQS